MRYHDTTSRMARIKTQITTSVGEGGEAGEPLCPARGREACSGCPGEQPGGSTAINHGATTCPAIKVRGTCPRELKTGPHKNLLTSSQSSRIHGSQKVETTQMPIDWWMNKQNAVHPCNGTLFHLKKEGDSVRYCHVDEPWGHGANWKKPATGDHILCDSISMKRPAYANLKIQNVD